MTDFYVGHMASLIQPQAWMTDAACTDSDPELWFADETDRYPNQAKQLCAGCPVIVECLDFGRDEPAGVWGGMTAHQRAKLRGTRLTPRTTPGDFLGRHVSQRAIERRRAAERKAAS